MRSVIIPAADLEGQIASLAAHLDAATHELLTLIRRFDDGGGWAGWGMKSCAHWLSWRIGMAPGAAREKVRVARALGGLPQIDEALRRGQISFSKVRAMTRIATADNEAVLLEMARNATAAQLERICHGVRVTQDRLLPDDRFVRVRPRPNGMVRIEIELLPDEAAAVVGMIDGRQAAALETGESLDRADALVRIAEEAATPAGERPERPQVVVHLQPDALAGGHGAELEDGTRVSAETLRRLACDAGIEVVAEAADGTALDVGRRSRVVPGAMRRALERRGHREGSSGCRFPGCTHGRFLHAHHIEHWMRGGRTTTENLVLLCSTHHRMVHEEGYGVRRAADGAFVFTTPAGAPVAAVPRRPAASVDGADALRSRHRQLGLGVSAPIISAETNLLDSYTPRPDYSACVAALAPA